jgi:EmrB/QacA subfamily drug resistance transporter
MSADPRRWWALAALCAAQFLIILDTSIVGIALPALQRELGLDAAGLAWVFNAYVIPFGGLLLLGGRLADLMGARRVLVSGFIVLTGASLAAGLASSGASLLAARAIQGAGAALIAPAALALIMTLFAARPAELGRALGFWGAAAAAGGTAGVFLGGVFTEWLGWRWTFLVNVPVGLGVLAAAFALLPRGEHRKGSVDLAGAAAVTLGLALLVYTVVTINDVDASWARSLGLLGASAGLLVAFVAIQRRRREPLLPLGLFATPNLTAGNVVMALLGAAWIPMWFFLNMVLQQVLGLGAFASGLALLPMTLAIMVLMMAIAPRVIGRLGPKRTLVVGLAILAGALALLARLPVDASFGVDVLLPSLVAAAGMSLAYIPAMIIASSGARSESQGLASGVINTTYQVGSAVGLAVMVAVAGGRSAELAGQGAAAAVHGGAAWAFGGAAVVASVAALLAAWRIRVAASPAPAVRRPEGPRASA